MATRKKHVMPANGTLLIVTATEAEALFFSQMRKDCRFANLTVTSVEAKNLEDMINKTGKIRSQGRFDAAFALFGFDDLDTNVPEIQTLAPLAEKKRVELCYFNPSFELWIYLHVATQPQSFVGDKSMFHGIIESKLPGFSMTANYLLTKGLNLHMRLFPRHAMADLAARNYNDIVQRATGMKATSMPDLNVKIAEICGQADMSHSTKVFK